MLLKKMNLNDNLTMHIPIQRAAIAYPDAFGLEVELEGKGIYPPPPPVQALWQHHNDGSLRKLKPGDQTSEYTSRQPYNLQSTEKALDILFEFLNSEGVEVYESYRTSIHVHVNFATETFKTIYNFITICIILDELLVSQNGDHRIGNNFCLRAKDASGQVMELISSVLNGNNFFEISPNARYSSINFASLMKFGSIEFRSLECTMHKGRIMHWINTLQHMKDSAKGFKNPQDIISKFSLVGPLEFLEEILGPFARKYRDVTGANEMLRNGMRIAQDFAFCSEWRE